MAVAITTDRVTPIRPCPICASTAANRLQTMRFALPDGHPLADYYDVVCCERCGFVYADTRSSQADYDSYYADLSKYSDAATGTGAGAQGWDQSRLADTAKTLADRLTDPAARIVDIGCANGGLLAELARLGYTRLFGVDPSPACAAATQSLAGVNAAVGSLFAMPNAALGVDCAILSHVLEHVRDIGSALGQLYDLLAPDGLAYVEVPDATRYSDCLVAPFQDFNVEHINHFSAASLSNALSVNGFGVEATIQKTIEASAGIPYPAVAALARRATRRTVDVPYDFATGPAIAEYIAQSRAQIDVLQRNLESALRGVREVVIWGTGQTTLTVLSHTDVGGAQVVALTDSNPRYHGCRLAGVPVISPNELAGTGAPILIGSLIHHVAIERRIRELGLPNRIVHLSVD